MLDLPVYTDKNQVQVCALQMQNLRINDRNSFPYHNGTLTFWPVAAEYPEFTVEEQWVPVYNVLEPFIAPGWYFVVNQHDGSVAFLSPEDFDALYTPAKGAAPKEIKAGKPVPQPQVEPFPLTPVGPVAVQPHPVPLTAEKLQATESSAELEQPKTDTAKPTEPTKPAKPAKGHSPVIE
jgi:hypothetical protein